MGNLLIDHAPRLLISIEYNVFSKLKCEYISRSSSPKSSKSANVHKNNYVI